eukprot:15432125-Alexandrium_andersonii.AAC.1
MQLDDQPGSPTRGKHDETRPPKPEQGSDKNGLVGDIGGRRRQGGRAHGSNDRVERQAPEEGLDGAAHAHASENEA